MQSRNLILVGDIASGKTTLASELCKKYGFKKVVTYTTRPPRPGEVDGVDYHFVTEEDFKELEEEEFFLETTSYARVDGLYYYGTSKTSFSTTNDNVAILNPKGVMALDGVVDAYVVWLDIPQDILFERALKRGDSPEELNRRYIEDRAQFEEFNRLKLWNRRITRNQCVGTLAYDINSLFKY